MKVAVPLFNDEVSPRFGCSTHVLVATVDQESVRVEQTHDLSGRPPCEWPGFLESLEIRKIVCGGIHERFQTQLRERGIEVIWGVIGSAAEALAALQNGSLKSDQFVCGGRRGRHRNRGGGCRGLRGNQNF